MTGLVNAHLTSVPPGWTLDERRMTAWLKAPSAWSAHYPDSPALPKRDLGITVDGKPVAAGQYVVAGGSCVPLWMAADREEPAALEAWLGALEDLAREAGCGEIRLTRNELGIGWTGVCLAWDHLVRGLREAGFEEGDRWVIMTAPTGASGDPGEPPFRTARLDRRENPAAREWMADVRVGDVPAADSDCWGPPEGFRDCPGFAEWMVLEWIGVEEPFRRRGLGRWLLRSQMRWLADRGIRRVMLYSETDNAAARRLFEAEGFAAGPECWEMRKAI